MPFTCLEFDEFVIQSQNILMDEQYEYLLQVYGGVFEVLSHCLWGSVFGICFVLHFLVSCLVLQLSSRGKESWLIALIVVSVVLLFLVVP